MDDCIFCKIANGNIPARIIYRDDLVLAFHDIHPIAPVHILIVPFQHLESVNETLTGDEHLLGHMILVARTIAELEDVKQSGYRLVFNTGPDGGQTIPHLHLHLIGGKRLFFPLQEFEKYNETG
jgi:histidine triad (HIT) family protein